VAADDFQPRLLAANHRLAAIITRSNNTPNWRGVNTSVVAEALERAAE